MSVDRCVCHDWTFEQLKALAEQLGPKTTAKHLGQRTGAGTGCSLCRPYLELMLKTGRTSFAVLDDDAGPPSDQAPDLASDQASGDSA